MGIAGGWGVQTPSHAPSVGRFRFAEPALFRKDPRVDGSERGGSGPPGDNQHELDRKMNSGIWLVCSACGLRHSVRQDERCPRCGGPSGASPLGEAWRARPAALPSSEGSMQTLGMRLVGGALILGILLIAARYLIRDRPGPPAPGASVQADAPQPRPTETQRALPDPPPLQTTSTPTYLQKAFSDLPHSRPAPRRPR